MTDFLKEFNLLDIQERTEWISMQGPKKAYAVNVGMVNPERIEPPNKSSRSIYQSYNRQELVLYSIC
jgi:hypothetical protein